MVDPESGELSIQRNTKQQNELIFLVNCKGSKQVEMLHLLNQTGKQESQPCSQQHQTESPTPKPSTATEPSTGCMCTESFCLRHRAWMILVVVGAKVAVAGALARSRRRYSRFLRYTSPSGDATDF